MLGLDLHAATMAFSNVEIQQVIYEDLSQLRRRMLHRHVGKTLEKFYADKLAPVASRLAYHFIQAGDRESAFIYSLKAGQHAQSLYAYQTALRWYSQAVDRLPSPTHQTADQIADKPTGNWPCQIGRDGPCRRGQSRFHRICT